MACLRVPYMPGSGELAEDRWCVIVPSAAWGLHGIKKVREIVAYLATTDG